MTVEFDKIRRKKKKKKRTFLFKICIFCLKKEYSDWPKCHPKAHSDGSWSLCPVRIKRYEFPLFVDYLLQLLPRSTCLPGSVTCARLRRGRMLCWRSPSQATPSPQSSGSVTEKSWGVLAITKRSPSVMLSSPSRSEQWSRSLGLGMVFFERILWDSHSREFFSF